MDLSQFEFYHKLEPDCWDYSTGQIRFWYHGKPEFATSEHGRYRTAVVWEMCGKQRTPPGWLRCESFNMAWYPEVIDIDDTEGWREVVYRYTGIYRGMTTRKLPKKQRAVCGHSHSGEAWVAPAYNHNKTASCDRVLPAVDADPCHGNTLDQEVANIKRLMGIIDCTYHGIARADDDRRCDHPKPPLLRPHIRRFGVTTTGRF